MFYPLVFVILGVRFYFPRLTGWFMILSTDRVCIALSLFSKTSMSFVMLLIKKLISIVLMEDL